MKIIANVDIENLPGKKPIEAGKYIVARRCGRKLWYYGCYDGRSRAEQVAEELENGIVVETAERIGTWIHRHDDQFDWYECSECGYGEDGEVGIGHETPCCPMCGKRLVAEVVINGRI